MSSVVGTRFGPFEVVAAIGAGGMGEVYRARDTRLKREVALKILPESFATDPDRLARFQREAEVLASLNHPNIAAIHGLEESEGVRALVMELVEGETLADRIARGAIPIDEALPIAKQIAEALEAAHERGIIHRDLKPANIKVRSDGTVKVLDFGLAKLHDPNAQNVPNVPNDPNGPNQFSISPTITSPALMTGVGMLLGTAAYMSPEQAKGRPTDKRSDIWAFGCVLYEMLTGKRAFPGADVSETLAGVIKSEPDWTAVPDDTPASIRRMLRRCLQKDPRRRLHDVGDARIELEEPPEASPRVATPPRWRRASLVAAVLALVTVTGLAARFTLSSAPGAAVVFDVTAPAGARIDIGEPLSPDGRTVAFIATSETGPPQIWVRPLDSATARALSGTEQAQRLFWSADSQWIGYFAQGKLAKVSITGGPPFVVANEASRDGAWSREDVILIGGQRGKPMLRVSAAGGQASPVTDMRANEISHDYPDFLPDGRHFLFLARAATSVEASAVYVGSLDSKERHLLQGIASGARYSPTGHVLFVRDSTLMAQAFDVRRFELSGTPFPVARNVPGPVAPFSASSNGTLAYLTGSIASNSELTWFDRNGRPLARAAPRGAYAGQALSPDDNYIAFSNAGSDIWVLDIRKEVASRLTTDPSADTFPVWSPDGRRVAFSSTRGGTSNLYERSVGVVGEDKVLLKSDAPVSPRDWSSDGRYLFYTARGDIWALPMFGDKKPMRVTETPFAELDPVLSPDGRWMAYSTDETGDDQIYIQSFPQPGARQQVSGTGGFQPRWSRDGKELFYIRPDFTMMSVSVKASGPTLEVSAPVVLFRKQLALLGPAATQRNYSVSADRRFLMNVSPDDVPRPITVVLNWASTLKK